ncbi:MAG: hypothetical protein M3M98_01785 [Nitrospirota bacterium]|nr:hypothetical protein [Nitrospirota bacterium]
MAADDAGIGTSGRRPHDVLRERLKEQYLAITSSEATILELGLYEETGSF